MVKPNAPPEERRRIKKSRANMNSEEILLAQVIVRIHDFHYVKTTIRQLGSLPSTLLDLSTPAP